MTIDNSMDDLVSRTRRMVEIQAERSERLNRQMEGLTIVGSNHDGSVKVRLDSTGGLADLKIADEAMNRSGRELRDDIMRGITTARRHLSERVAEIAFDVYGPGSATGAFLSGAYADRFGTPDDERNGGRR